MKVAVIGTIGSGKDTLTRLLSTKLTSFSPRPGERCKVRDIQEYSVFWIDKTGKPEEIFEQFWMWYHQTQWDHDYDSRHDDPFTVIISAAPSPLSFFYAQAFTDRKERKHRQLLQDLYGKALYELDQFDIIFYLPLEFKVPEGDRLRKHDMRVVIDNSIRAFLNSHRFDFVELRGTEEKRTRLAFSVLKRIIKRRTKIQIIEP